MCCFCPEEIEWLFWIKVSYRSIVIKVLKFKCKPPCTCTWSSFYIDNIFLNVPTAYELQYITAAVLAPCRPAIQTLIIKLNVFSQPCNSLKDWWYYLQNPRTKEKRHYSRRQSRWLFIVIIVTPKRIVGNYTKSAKSVLWCWQCYVLSLIKYITNIFIITIMKWHTSEV